MKKLVIIYSGGMDSFTVLNKAVKDGFDVFALSFDYGQKHNKELIYAQNVCSELNIPHKILDIKSISNFSSDLYLPSI